MAETPLLVEAIHAALPDVSPARCRFAALNVQRVLEHEAATGSGEGVRAYLTPIPCRHPPDPVAEWVAYEWLGDPYEYPLCHCGRILNEALGHAIEGAPGPVVNCDNCGCHVAIPPRP